MITPPSLGFQLLTPSPVMMRFGTLIDYWIRLLHVPVRWTTYIAAFKPPEQFVDVQLRGPYAFWHHTHRFEEIERGTVIEDEVLYLLPFGPLGKLVHVVWVQNELMRIFDYRQNRIRQLFGEGAADSSCGGSRSGSPELAKSSFLVSSTETS